MQRHPGLHAHRQDHLAFPNTLNPVLDIQTPPGCETERAYILSVLLDDWLGLPYRLTQAARDDVCIRLTDQPGELRLPDHFFSQFREAPEAWLSDASLPVLTPAVQLPSWDSRALAPDILLTDPRLPILYGDADTSPGPGRAAEQGDRIDLPLDVFGAA
ncbi:hypothetical protein CCR96_12550, partial [Halochromatium roseum]|nr:hypothetical protein [Halochromatium roseum]